MTTLTLAITIRRDCYGEFDRQYIIYTRDLGKISAIAKGAAKTASKLSGHLEPLSASRVMVANGSAHHRLAGAQIAKSYAGVAKDFGKRIMASYFLETVDILVKSNFPDQELFGIIDGFFSRLSLAGSFQKSLLLLNKAVFDLLSHLGYCPVVRAKNQRQLAKELNNLAVSVAEREIRSFALLAKLVNAAN